MRKISKKLLQRKCIGRPGQSWEVQKKYREKQIIKSIIFKDFFFSGDKVAKIGILGSMLISVTKKNSTTRKKNPS